jgi:hypothetical protein
MKTITRLPVIVGLLSRAMATAIGLITMVNLAGAQTQQEHVHHMAHTVMPFSMSKTVHVFKMTEQGGVMRVITREAGASDQVPLIQQHLQHEATQFQKGDFSDPAKLHGATMPGLKELEAGAAKMKVTYEPLPNGGAIRFETSDLHLLTAIHRWFGAQLSEHGADAQEE